MPWGNFPLIGIILGLAGGYLQFTLLKKLISLMNSDARALKTIGILAAKLAVYALFFAASFLTSLYDVAACGILMALMLVVLSLYKSFRKGGKNR